MFRYLVLPTLAALVLVPDWASAFFRRRSAPYVTVAAAPVQYYGPVCYPAPACPPMFQPPVYIVPAAPATPATTPQVTPERTINLPKTTPTPDMTPKAGGGAPLPPPNIPGGTTALPAPRSVEVAPPPPVAPVAGTDERVPPPNVPLVPVPAPSAVVPLTPNPAPAPDFIPAVPPVVPQRKTGFDPAPPKEEPKAPAVVNPGTLPKMELPDLNAPGLPPLAQPRPVEAKASPLRDLAKPAYDLFPTDGPAPAGPDEKRSVTFHNFTGRDMLLTVDGTTTTLPAKHTVTGKVGAKFKMHVGVGDAVEVTVPAAASGADVVLKK